MNLGRDTIADQLVRDLVGPAGGDEERLEQRPSEVYISGAVYPVGYRGNETQNEDLDDPMQQTTKFFPSALGMSVTTQRGSEIRITADFGSYREGKEKIWLREKHEVHAALTFKEQQGALNQTFQFEKAPYAAITVHVRRLPAKERDLVTVMIVNRHQASAGKEDAHILFQARVSLESSVALVPVGDDGVAEMLMTDHEHLGEEEEDRLFLYRDSEPLAHGHGIAVNWSDDRKRVWTDTIPRSLVHGLRSDPAHFADLDLSLEALAGPKRDDLVEALTDRYAAWVGSLAGKIERAEQVGRFGRAASRVTTRQSSCLERLRSGQLRLAEDPLMQRAWTYALQAMKLQFERPAILSDRPRGRASLRPFQVAYLLLVLPGLGVDGASHPSREIVDLLWFPTGGGKTEAYLLVILVEAFLRRLQDPEDNGSVALSRYTYRMLAFDQFSRAAASICAAELVRAEASAELGKRRFSAGLWIGSSQTPNKLASIDESYDKREPTWRTRWIKADPSFPLVNCPWCGRKLQFDEGYLAIEPANGEFALFCPNDPSCPFSSRSSDGIPIAVVDDHIYRSRPTIVVATADKLAQLPVWSASEGPSILKGDVSRGAGPISIFVFDELHLLSGPLGTIASLYEIAVDAIVSSAGKWPARPKILASTATIRTAGSQVQGLLGRSVATFPVSGTEPDDSFWAMKDDRPETARLYLGTMTSGSTWQALFVYSQTSIFRSTARLPVDQRDPYWTSIVYAGTLRDHGRSVSLIGNDIRSRLTQFDDGEPREIRLVDELRGDRIGSRLPQVLAALKRSYSPGDNEALDAVVTTNLFQVGIDVPRLGLMVMLGQPKGTAEYIQASSRIGRTAESSGLVLTLFQHTRPRDRSHYEDFKGYHSALYRAVEPISVTPLADSALERCLRAVFVSIARHAISSDGKADAKTVGEDLAALAAAAELISTAAADREDGIATLEPLKELLGRLRGEWSNRASTSGGMLWTRADQGLRQFPMLMAPRIPPTNGPEWPYDTSMRSVDATVDVHSSKRGLSTRGVHSERR